MLIKKKKPKVEIKHLLDRWQGQAQKQAENKLCWGASLGLSCTAPGLTTTAAAAEHVLSTGVHQVNDIKILL